VTNWANWRIRRNRNVHKR